MDFPPPFVLHDAPLGTYAQMTQLGLMLGILQFGLIALGSAMSFRIPFLGGLLLVLSGFLGLLDGMRSRLQDPSLPLASFIFGVVLALLVLAAGGLVLATWIRTPSVRNGPGSASSVAKLTRHGPRPQPQLR